MVSQPRRAWQGLAGKAWALGVTLRKQVIAWQDRLGLYPYSAWIMGVERAAIRAALAEPLTGQSAKPVVCFVIAAQTVSLPDLARTLASLKQQSGLDWRLALIVPVSCISQLRAELNGEQRVQLVMPSESARIDGVASMPAAILDILPGDWLVPLEAGDRLPAYWHNLFLRALHQHPQAEIFYWDEDVQEKSGRRTQPCFKPGWSPELLFSRNDLESAAFCRRVLRAGDGLFGVTRAAREVVHLPFVLQHRSPGFTQGQPARLARHAQRVQEVLRQRGEQEIEAVPRGDHLSIRWKAAEPLVSIIIPTKNNLGYLQRCLSTLLAKTVYSQYEIVLMDDHSTDPAVQAYYQELRAQVPNLRIFDNEEGPFNYSRVNNHGARQARGELLLFLNNDVEILTPDWLSELARWAQQPGVGMVGAKLLYPDGAIQHAGIVIGMTGHANHVYAGRPPVKPGLFPSPDTLRNVSAVTGACMLVRRDVFEQVGGFNEDLSLVFNDVELGLRLVNSGWRVVYNPAAELIHYEGRSRARFIPPANIRLGAELLRETVRAGDPYYHPYLSDEVNWPSLRRATQPRRLWLLENIVRYKG
jgi:O-antigen biosynthesis protein